MSFDSIEITFGKRLKYLLFQEELLIRIGHKLDVLRAEQLSLKEEITLNEELGSGVREAVHSLAKPNECVKFNMHVTEIDKITSLLLGLSGRLARTENELQSLPEDGAEDQKVCDYILLISFRYLRLIL